MVLVYTERKKIMNIEFYKNSNGKEPVKNFIDNLSNDNKKLLSAKL